MPNFIQITPFMHVDDIDRAIAFFTDILEFKVGLRFEDYAYLYRENVGIRMLQNRGSDGAPPGNRRFAYYIDVRDVEALYAELKPKLDTLPPRDVHGPGRQALRPARTAGARARRQPHCLRPGDHEAVTLMP